MAAKADESATKTTTPSKETVAGGMEVTPPVFERPYLRDPFLWLVMAAIAFWAVVIWLIWG